MPLTTTPSDSSTDFSYRHRREPGSYADAEYEAAESRLQHSLNYATIATHAFHTDKVGDRGYHLRLFKCYRQPLIARCR